MFICDNLSMKIIESKTELMMEHPALYNLNSFISYSLMASTWRNVPYNPFIQMYPNLDTLNSRSIESTNRNFNYNGMSSQSTSQYSSPICSSIKTYSPCLNTISPLIEVHKEARKTTRRQVRSEKKPIPEEKKDEKYFERRKRNNFAAKRSRDTRKAKSNELSARVNSLQQENTILVAQIGLLKEELQSLNYMLYKKSFPSCLKR